MKKIIILAILLMATPVMADDVTFQWDANTEPDLAGYHLYQGTVSGGPYTRLTNPGDIGPTVTTYTLPNVADGVWFYVLTAYDSETPSLESDYSNEVSITISNAPAPPSGFQAIIEVVINFFKSLFGLFRVA